MRAGPLYRVAEGAGACGPVQRLVPRCDAPAAVVRPALLPDSAPRSAPRSFLAAMLPRLSSGHGLLQVAVDRRQEILGVQPGLVLGDQQRQVLGHLTALDGLDAD